MRFHTLSRIHCSKMPFIVGCRGFRFRFKISGFFNIVERSCLCALKKHIRPSLEKGFQIGCQCSFRSFKNTKVKQICLSFASFEQRSSNLQRSDSSSGKGVSVLRERTVGDLIVLIFLHSFKKHLSLIRLVCR